MSLLRHIIRTYIKENRITKLQKLYSRPSNPRVGNKSSGLFVKKPFCTGDLLPTGKIFIERPVPSKEKIFFWEKRNTIFPDITKKIIFRCDIFGKTIFSYHLKETYFHVFFWERSSFVICLKNKIFSLKRTIVFPYKSRRIIFQCIFFGKTIFRNIWRKKISFFAVLVAFIFLSIFKKCIHACSGCSVSLCMPS